MKKRIFRGRHYALEDGKPSLEGSWKTIQAGIERVKFRYGSEAIFVLKALVKSDGVASTEDVKRKALPTVRNCVAC
jgi:hypothetical protein